MLVITYLTPEPLAEWPCHVCTPLIGGVVFVKQGERWIVESEKKIIGRGDVLESGAYELVKVGPEKYALAIHLSDALQGFETRRLLLLSSDQGILHTSLDVGFNQKPGNAAFIEGDAELGQQEIFIHSAATQHPEYFDLIVTLKYNEVVDSIAQFKEEKNRYQYLNGQFKLVAQ